MRFIRSKSFWVAGSLILIAGAGIMVYVFNKPHRDIQASEPDFRLSVTALVNEYLSDAPKANDKYLDEEGNSSILEVGGKVHSISRDLQGQYVVVLRDETPAGVSCTFMPETNQNAKALRPGDYVTIKGVIRSGAAYDRDLNLYEDVILEKCDIVHI